MADGAHLFGGDLQISSSGDVALVDGLQLGQQRVLRRLLTNSGDYIWNLSYGAGLAAFVGQPAAAMQIRAVVRSQIFKEAAVETSPEPVIEVTSDQAGTVYVHIRYLDAQTGTTQILNFSLAD